MSSFHSIEQLAGSGFAVACYVRIGNLDSFIREVQELRETASNNHVSRIYWFLEVAGHESKRTLAEILRLRSANKCDVFLAGRSVLRQRFFALALCAKGFKILTTSDKTLNPKDALTLLNYYVESIRAEEENRMRNRMIHH